MSDSAYRNALAKKERLIKELDEVNGFLRLYQRFAPKGTAGDSENRAQPEQKKNAESLFSGTTKAAPQKRQRVSTPDRFRPIIRSVLVAHNKPMPLGQLLNALASGGNPIPGEKPAKNLGTILWRLQDDFVNLEGHGYWLKDTPFASGWFNYKPPQSNPFG